MHPTAHPAAGTTLERGLAELGLPPSGVPRDPLTRYLAEIELWNPAYGLVNASGEELVVKHILDSLAPWKILEGLLDGFSRGGEVETRAGSDLAGSGGACPGGEAALTDLGTGAGLPGIPLALAMPGRRVRLVERMGKRVTFLESMKALLRLDNVEIVESEAERAPGPHAVTVFRAFRPFAETKLFRAVWANTAPGGAFAAYKGRRATAAEEIRALSADRALRADPSFAAALEGAEIIPLSVPFLADERCLVVIRKPVGA